MRHVPGYAPYEALAFAVPVLIDGDVNARVVIRIKARVLSHFLAMLTLLLVTGPVTRKHA